MFASILRWLATPSTRGFSFQELESLALSEWEVEFVAFDPPPVPHQEDAVWAQVPGASIKYVRSRESQGVIETMDMSLSRSTGHMPLFLKYEGCKCVGYSSAPPLWRLHEIRHDEAQHCLDAFGDRVRTLVSTQTKGGDG